VRIAVDVESCSLALMTRVVSLLRVRRAPPAAQSKEQHWARGHHSAGPTQTGRDASTDRDC
jgi:hypothetical protein